MSIKAIIFDVGETLVYYNNFLNWQALYPAALAHVMQECNIENTDERIANAQEILLKYNTRVNPREYEVNSNTIFSEILDKWKIEYTKLYSIKKTFYEFFSNGAAYFEDTEYVLHTLKNNDIKIALLTDVAYGMDNEFVYQDFESIIKYFDVTLTSTDVGYRKPRTDGYIMIQKEFNLLPCQIAYVGNEEKDIVGANNAGMVSVLINRDDKQKNYLQNHTITSLTEILSLFI